MDFEVLTSFISNSGFPIAVACAMCWYVKYTGDKHREQIDELNSTHSEEIKTMTQALNNNTLVLQKLCDRLENET